MSEPFEYETPAASDGLIYCDTRSNDAVEFGTVFGRDVALPVHFHDEDQITFVLSGRRRFVMGGGVRTIEVGRGVLLPARSVHRSLAEPATVTCLNLYVRAGEYDSAALMRAAERSWNKTSRAW